MYVAKRKIGAARKAGPGRIRYRMQMKKVAACLTSAIVLALALPVLAGAQTGEKAAEAATPAAQEAPEDTGKPVQSPKAEPEAEKAATAAPTPSGTPETRNTQKPVTPGALTLTFGGKDVTGGAAALGWTNASQEAPTGLLKATGPDGRPVTAVYKSSNESVAKIDASGLVTAAGYGVTTISASLYGHMVRFELAVSQEATRLVIIGEDAIAPGRSIKLRAFDQDGNRVSAIWRSASEKFATITPDGVMTASRTASGKTVEITATAGEAGVSATLTIRIE